MAMIVSEFVLKRDFFDFFTWVFRKVENRLGGDSSENVFSAV